METQPAEATQLLDLKLDDFVDRANVIIDAGHRYEAPHSWTRIEALRDPDFDAGGDSLTSWMLRRTVDVDMLLLKGPEYHIPHFDEHPNTYETSRFVLDALFIGPIPDDFPGVRDPLIWRAEANRMHKLMFYMDRGISNAGRGSLAYIKEASIPLSMVTSTFENYEPAKARELAEPVEAEYRRINERLFL